MSVDDTDDVTELKRPGQPAWVVTFGNLMSLLMCFFVLQLSFAQIETEKFKKIAESMGQTFGVPQEGELNKIPQGSSAIAREFSPGKPEPTALNEIRQKAEDLPTQAKLDEAVFEKVRQKKKEEMQDALDKAATEMGQKLVNEILSGIIQIETYDQHIVIRILEQDSFVTGEGEVRPSFIPVLNKIRKILESSKGNISIEGHTDDLPVFTSNFRSNWDLSVARAVSVAHLLLESSNGALDKKRISVSGHADSKPLFANDSKAHRASNRRIEIILSQNTPPTVDNVSHQLNKETMKKDAQRAPMTGNPGEKLTTTPMVPEKVTNEKVKMPAQKEIVPSPQSNPEKKSTSAPSSSIKTSIPDAKAVEKPALKNKAPVNVNPAPIEPAKPIKSQEVDQKFLLHE